MNDAPQKEWLTNKEAQQYLGLSKPTLARYRADGLLAFSKVRGNVFYPREAILDLLQRHVVNSPGALAEAT